MFCCDLWAIRIMYLSSGLISACIAPDHQFKSLFVWKYSFRPESWRLAADVKSISHAIAHCSLPHCGYCWPGLHGTPSCLSTEAAYSAVQLWPCHSICIHVFWGETVHPYRLTQLCTASFPTLDHMLCYFYSFLSQVLETPSLMYGVQQWTDLTIIMQSG